MSYFDVILCLLSYGAHCGLLCLLCRNRPTVCHTTPTRVPSYAYNVILKLQYLLWHTMLTHSMPIFHYKSPVCHNLPTKIESLFVKSPVALFRHSRVKLLKMEELTAYVF